MHMLAEKYRRMDGSKYDDLSRFLVQSHEQTE